MLSCYYVTIEKEDGEVYTHRFWSESDELAIELCKSNKCSFIIHLSKIINPSKTLATQLFTITEEDLQHIITL